MRCRALIVRCMAAMVGLWLFAAPAAAEPLHLRIVGGLAGITQFRHLEEPFWRDRIRELSGGRITATIHAFDRSGLRGQDMLQLMRLGVVSFGTAILTVVATDEPELSAVDLPALNPDFATLQRNVAAYRPHIETVLRERYGVALLGVYAYPAQVLFCAAPFSGLNDLVGRRVRTSSVSQSEMFAALGAVPVVMPFAEQVAAVRRQSVDCAITGTLSGHEIGLSEVTTHLHAKAVNWGLSIFAVNTHVWEAIPDDLRTIVRDGVRDLERRIWEAAEQDTVHGMLCNTGASGCGDARKGRMQLVDVSDTDHGVRRRVLVDSVLPRWLDRCGLPCVTAWNTRLSATTGITLDPAAIDGAAASEPPASR